MGTLPYSLKCITEARVGFIRMQKVGHAHFLISKSTYRVFNISRSLKNF
jgi:hypothetical protein